MNILAVNAGSATLKFALHSITENKRTVTRYTANFLDSNIVIKGEGEAFSLAKPSESDSRYGLAYQAVLEKLAVNIDIVVHRVVHGGDKFEDHQLITNEVIEELETLIPFAPLHQPFNLKLIRLTEELLPGVKQLACFDTQFHRSIPEVLRRYALPESCYQNGEKVYGYHGLSYEYISQYFIKSFPQFADDNILIAHIGSGASLCGVKQGKSAATSMGFSTIDGLPMSSRCGQLDPGLILYWLASGDSLEVIEKRLYKESGLKGLSGLSSDFQRVSESEEAQSKLALDVYTARVNQQIGSVVAALGGVQHIIFTAGVGENAYAFRAALAELLAKWLPVELDEVANRDNKLSISTAESVVELWVIPTDEELVMVEHAQRILNR